MIAIAKILGGAPSIASGMAKHLLNATLSVEDNRLAAYYGQDVQPDRALFVLAREVDEERLSFSEALDALVSRHIREGGDLDTLFDFEERMSRKLSGMIDRISDKENNLELAPVAQIRADLPESIGRALGIRPDDILSTQEVQAILAGRRADGDEIEGKKYATVRRLPVDPKTGERRVSHPIGSFDFTFSPDKSVSVAHAFSNDIEKSRIATAHNQAVAETMALIEKQIGRVTIDAGGQRRYEDGKIGWLTFTHHTSRPVQAVVKDGAVEFDDKPGARGDPELHTHVLIPNVAISASGHVGSLDTAGIRGFRYEADAFYHARLATMLRDAGFAVERDDRTGAARMTAVPQEVSKLFSKRTEVGEAAARKMTADRGEDWDALSDDERATRIKNVVQHFKQKKHGDKDPKADITEWRREAKEAHGWEASTFEMIGPPPPPLAPGQRQRLAYEASLPLLDKALQQESVLSHHKVRGAAISAFIDYGFEGTKDADAATLLMRQEGVLQYGERTALQWGQEEGARHVAVTTALHEADEREFVRLAREATTDKSAEIPTLDLKKAIQASGLDFTGKHGEAQLRAIHMLNTGGRFSVAIGSAGSGKTALLQPIVAAKKEMGWDVIGASLAWRQADDLVNAGIHESKVKALSILLDGLKDGSIAAGPKTLVIVDEFGLLGTKQGLELLRHRERYGFQVMAVGDDKQAQAQPMDSKVLTPDGFRKIGDLVPGDTVLTPSGRLAHVTAVQDMGIKDVHRLTFSDGRTAECCGDHLWKVWTLPRPSPVDVDRAALQMVSMPSGEQRVLDKSLGAAMGLGRQGRDIRTFIGRNKSAMMALDGGNLATRAKPRQTGYRGAGGPPATEYLLNKEQVNFVIGKSRISYASGIGKRGGRSSPNSPFRWMIRPTREIAAWFTAGLGRHVAIPLVMPCSLDLGDQHLPIPPYALGLLLGDGHFAHGIVHYCTMDEYLIDRLMAELPAYRATAYKQANNRATNYHLSLRCREEHTSGRRRRSASETMTKFARAAQNGGRRGTRPMLIEHNGVCRTLKEWSECVGLQRAVIWRRLARLGWTVSEALGFEKTDRKHGSNIHSPLSRSLNDLGLAGTRSHSKFIPGIYKAGTVSQRLDIIRGLLDTDGTVGEGGTYAVYTSVSKRLAEDVQYLARSLGAISTITAVSPSGQRRRTAYKVTITHPDIAQFFALPRKVEITRQCSISLRLRITSINPIGRKETRCIAISDPEGLYVTDNFVVTHNSIEAGAIIDLSRRALGPERIPVIFTTIRQQTERERQIVGLLREGRAAEALTMKRSDGTAEMVKGGTDAVTRRVADLYMQRWRETGEFPTISAPTNSDAHRISEAVRRARRQAGQLGEDLTGPVKATDGERTYIMRLARGDRVRLFESTSGIDVQTGRKVKVGRNGSVVTILDAAKATDGLRLRVRNAKGREAFIAFEVGSVKLAYGDALTIHSAQGLTSTEHIFALPNGSGAVNGLLGYVAGTRHRRMGFIVTNAQAETHAVRKGRALNDTREITDDDRWAQVAKALAWQPEKDTALALLERVRDLRRGTIRILHDAASPAMNDAARNVQERTWTQELSRVARQVMDHVPGFSRRVEAGRGPEMVMRP